MENTICIIKIYSECCICLDYLNVDCIKLDCCDNTIHTKCIYNMFVHTPFNVNENKVIFTCPLCRKQKNFKKVISLKNIKKYTNDYNIINKYKQDNFDKYKEIRTFVIIFLCVIILIFIFIK